MENLTGPICGKHLFLGGVFYFAKNLNFFIKSVDNI